MRRALSPLPATAIAGALVLIGLLAYGIAQNDPDRGLERALARGDRERAPAITLPVLGGKGRRSLSDYRGQVVVLNYWASWCEPCRRESPLLERWHRRLAKEGGTVLGVDVLDVTADAQKFIREFGLTYPMLRDVDGSSQEKFGVLAYPETFVIDREGRVAASRRGPVDERFLRRSVGPLVKEPATGAAGKAKR